MNIRPMKNTKANIKLALSKTHYVVAVDADNHDKAFCVVGPRVHTYSMLYAPEYQHLDLSRHAFSSTNTIGDAVSWVNIVPPGTGRVSLYEVSFDRSSPVDVWEAMAALASLCEVKSLAQLALFWELLHPSADYIRDDFLGSWYFAQDARKEVGVLPVVMFAEVMAHGYRTKALRV